MVPDAKQHHHGLCASVPDSDSDMQRDVIAADFLLAGAKQRYEHKPVHEKDMLKVARKGLGFTQHKNESTQEIPVVDRLNPARLILEVQSVDCHPITDSYCA